MSTADETLPALLERRYGVPPKRTLGIAAALVVAIFLLWLLVIRNPLDGKTQALHTHRPVFNFLYDSSVIHQRKAHTGELLRLAAHNGPLKTTTVVTRFTLPPYQGDASGALPVYAENRLSALKTQYTRFRITADNRARVHKAPGYEIGFTFSDGAGRVGEGTDLYVLPIDAKHPTNGLVLSYRLTKASGRQPKRRRKVAKQMRSALRSFEFGSKRF